MAMASTAARIIVQVAERHAWTARKVKNPILRKQCRMVGRNLRGSEEWQQAMQPCLARLVRTLAEKTRLWEEVPVRRHPVVPILVRVCAYEKDWLRPPEEWQAPAGEDAPDVIIRSLLEHTFVRYEIPAFLYHAWLVRGDLQWRERDWFVRLARGASWRDLSGLPATISRRALHECRHAPAHLSIAQGLRWGQVMASGGSAALAHEVVTSRMAHDMTHDAWWSRLIGKFSAAGRHASRHYGMVSDMLVEMFDQERYEKAGRLLALPMSELCAHANGFWRDACASLAVHLPEWQQRDHRHPECRQQVSHLMRQHWHPLFPRSAQRPIRMRMGLMQWRELTNAAELIAEGRTMRHCVASRVHACLHGHSSVLIITIVHAGGEERLTMEICRKTRVIREVRGRYNRHPSDIALHCLDQWAIAMGGMVA